MEIVPGSRVKIERLAQGSFGRLGLLISNAEQLIDSSSLIFCRHARLSGFN